MRSSAFSGSWMPCAARGTQPTATETVHQRCQRYRRELRLPAVVMPESERIILHQLSGLLGVVVMPSGLATEVIRLLDTADQLGPVIANPGARRTTFLTGPKDGLERDIAATLLRLNIGIKGTYAVLPCPLDEHAGSWRWISERRDGYLPPMRAVLDAVLGVC